MLATFYMINYNYKLLTMFFAYEKNQLETLVHTDSNGSFPSKDNKETAAEQYLKQNKILEK